MRFIRPDDHFLEAYSPRAVYKHLGHSPAYSACYITAMPTPVFRPSAYSFMGDYGIRIPNLASETTPLYRQRQETAYDVSLTPMVEERLPQPDTPEPAYDGQVDRIFIELAMEELFDGGDTSSALEGMASTDDWGDRSVDNASVETTIADVVDGISGASTAANMPETDLADAPLFDEILGDPSDTSSVEQLPGDAIDNQPDASLEDILDEPVEDPEQMEPYMPPELFPMGAW